MTGRPLNVGDRVIFARPQGGNSKGGLLDSGTITKINLETGYVSVRVDKEPETRYGKRVVGTPYHKQKFYKLEG
ncbi:hypothetical protein SEA_ENYGMA_137 [Streptomyces phage Enygma]